MKTFRNHLKNKLKDKAFAEAYTYEQELLAIAMKINEERTKHGLSQVQLAQKARITQQQLSKIEHGENCNILTFLKVSKALDLEVDVVKSTAG